MDQTLSKTRALPLAAWMAFGIVLVGELLLFLALASARHAWIYPRWNDQIQYLTEAYTGYEHLKETGVLRGLAAALVNPSAQGTLHDFGALLVFSFTGPSRSAALALNVLAVIAWQAALFAAVWRETRRIASAALAAALPLALIGPWLVRPGSAFDFRLDHLAVCALGIATAAALATRGFRERQASLLFGASLAILLLTRFLTGTYLVVAFLLLAIGLIRAPDWRPRLANLLLGAVVAAAIAGPIFWINRDWVWNYYFIGHFTGPESALRSPNLGVLASLRFVLREWAALHVGAVWAALVAGLAALGWWRLRRSPAQLRPRWTPDLWIGLVFFAAPLVVLTLHQQKSEVVLGILSPGAVLIALAVVRRFTPPDRSASWLAAGGVFVALAFFGYHQAQAKNDPAFSHEARRLLQLSDAIYDASIQAGLARPRIATDEITDYLDAQILRVVCYERRGRWIPYEMTLPTGIAAATEEDIMQRLRQSDFVFLTTTGSRGTWPFDEQMRRLQPQLLEAAGAFTPAGQYELFGRKLSLHVRPGVTIHLP